VAFRILQRRLVLAEEKVSRIPELIVGDVLADSQLGGDPRDHSRLAPIRLPLYSVIDVASASGCLGMCRSPCFERRR